MTNHNELTQKIIEVRQLLQEGESRTQSMQERASYVMLNNLTQTLLQLSEKLEVWRKEPRFRKVIINNEIAFYVIAQETLQGISEMCELPFKVILGRKYYEDIEEHVADLDDWIENINEELEAFDESLEYVEAWDIGVYLNFN